MAHRRENAIAACGTACGQRCTVPAQDAGAALSGCARRSRVTRLIYAATREEIKRAQASSENGGSSTVRRRQLGEPATGSSPSRCRQSGARWTQRHRATARGVQATDQTQTVLPSADLPHAVLGVARLRPDHMRRSTAGKRSLQPLINQLTSPLDQIASSYRRMRRANSNHMPGGTRHFSAEHCRRGRGRYHRHRQCHRHQFARHPGPELRHQSQRDDRRRQNGHRIKLRRLRPKLRHRDDEL